jgi:two-component system sensor histidine kinase BaeS
MRGRLRGSLAGKLLAAQLLVILAGSATLALVAIGIAPGLFRSHVRRALGVVSDTVSQHLDQAFDDAILVALGIAILAAVVAAIAVSWFLSLRLVSPIRTLAAAAQRIAQGAYGARVPVRGSDELAVLAAAFNDMAGSLESGERRRRELIADVAHELRTPLATLEGYAEGLADGVIPADAEAWRVLRTETRRLGRLVEDLNEVSQAEERQLDLRIAGTDPGALVAAAARAAAPAYAAKGVRLETRIDERLGRIAADPDRIGEVLGNLLDNALRHTPSGGRVELGAARRGDAVELAVADSGEGIPPELLERVFERFYRVDRARARSSGGSGLGLAIARAVVEAHGGRMHAESEGPGRGARLVFTIPLEGAPGVGLQRPGRAGTGGGA